MPSRRPVTAETQGAIREVGQALKNWRENKDYTLRGVANETGVPAPDINRIELGQTISPPFRTICILADYLGHTPNEIAEMYGYWQPKSESRDPRIRRAAELVLDLPPEGREELLRGIEMACRMAEERYRH